MFGVTVTCPKNYGQCGASIEYDPGKLFVLMPFKEEQAPQKLFTDVLVKIPGWNIIRADKDFTKPEIWCKICANIQESRAVIADLSGHNPNVFLELGLAWGFGRPFVLLSQDRKNLPFDTISFHVIKYTRDGEEVENKDELTNELLRSLVGIPELPPLTRLPMQTPEGYLNQRIANARGRVIKEFWKLENGVWRIVDISSEAYRIALILLKAYPNTKTQAEIANETTLNSGSVTRILRGTRGDFSKYFKKVKQKWTLSGEGIYWLLDKVIPELLSTK